jgi:hypothetical protein
LVVVGTWADRKVTQFGWFLLVVGMVAAHMVIRIEDLLGRTQLVGPSILQVGLAARWERDVAIPTQASYCTSTALGFPALSH